MRCSLLFAILVLERKVIPNIATVEVLHKTIRMATFQLCYINFPCVLLCKNLLKNSIGPYVITNLSKSLLPWLKSKLFYILTQSESDRRIQFRIKRTLSVTVRKLMNDFCSASRCNISQWNMQNTPFIHLNCWFQTFIFNDTPTEDITWLLFLLN